MLYAWLNDVLSNLLLTLALLGFDEKHTDSHATYLVQKASVIDQALHPYAFSQVELCIRSSFSFCR